MDDAMKSCLTIVSGLRRVQLLNWGAAVGCLVALLTVSIEGSATPDPLTHRFIEQAGMNEFSQDCLKLALSVRVNRVASFSTETAAENALSRVQENIREIDNLLADSTLPEAVRRELTYRIAECKGALEQARIVVSGD